MSTTKESWWHACMHVFKIRIRKSEELYVIIMRLPLESQVQCSLFKCSHWFHNVSRNFWECRNWAFAQLLMFAFKLLPLLFASLPGSWNFGQLLQHLCCCLLKTGRPAIESAGAAASEERWRRGSTHTCLPCSQAWVGVWCFLGEEKLDSHIWRTFRCWWSVLLGEALISLFENRCFLPWQAVSSGTFLALTANLKRPLQLQDWESNMPQLQMNRSQSVQRQSALPDSFHNYYSLIAWNFRLCCTDRHQRKLQNVQVCVLRLWPVFGSFILLEYESKLTDLVAA